MFNLFKKKRNVVKLVFNNDEINTLCLLLYEKLSNLENKTNYNSVETNEYIISKRYYKLLNNKQVAVIPVSESDREDLLWLTVLLMREADKTKDTVTKDWLYSIAARIQMVHRGLGE